MRSGRIEEAAAIAKQVGIEIARQNARTLKHVDAKTNVKALWSTVKRYTSRSPCQDIATGFQADDLNKHYAQVSTDGAYESPAIKYTVGNEEATVSEYQVFLYLDKLHITATGLDKLPAWFLRLGAPVLARPISRLFNQSLIASKVPSQWKQALIKPIPKVKEPSSCSDFRPISITPVLARLMEKVVVREIIYPAIQNPGPELSFDDQFAFRPSGSTTAALIMLLQTITTLLQTNSFVLVYALDFSKAFDTVRHYTLLEKFALLNLPDRIYNWLVNYFEGRTHCTFFGGLMSALEEITAGVIQGSGLGPAAYIVDASDLRTVYPGNYLIKYADDTYLIIPAHLSHTRIEELENIEIWAKKNNLRLNQSKSEEMIFSNPRSKVKFTPPPSPLGIPRVKSMKVLGVILTGTFSMSEHITKIVSSCAQALYAIRMLMAHGLNQSSIQLIFSTTILAKLQYASQAWIGFANTSDMNRLEAFLVKSKRSGFCPSALPSFEELCNISDLQLFNSVVSNTHHVLYKLLPPKRDNSHNLRPRAHEFTLPDKATSLHSKNFIIRQLFRNIY